MPNTASLRTTLDPLHAAHQVDEHDDGEREPDHRWDQRDADDQIMIGSQSQTMADRRAGDHRRAGHEADATVRRRRGRVGRDRLGDLIRDCGHAFNVRSAAAR